jgi:hypothetical protein
MYRHVCKVCNNEWNSKIAAEACPACGATGPANIGYSYFEPGVEGKEPEPRAQELTAKAETISDKIKPKSNLDLAIERARGKES